MSLRRASFSRAPPYLPPNDDDESDMDLDDDSPVDQLADDHSPHPSDGESELDHDDRPPPPLPAGTFQPPPQNPQSLEYQRQLSIRARDRQERRRRENGGGGSGGGGGARERGAREGGSVLQAQSHERGRHDERRHDERGERERERNPHQHAHPHAHAHTHAHQHPHAHHHRPREWREGTWDASRSPAPSTSPSTRKDSGPLHDTQSPPSAGSSLDPTFGVLKPTPAVAPPAAPPRTAYAPPAPPPPLPIPSRFPGPRGHSAHSGSPWLYVGEEADYDDSDDEHERPKKRRRTRVALSCAECKRRKIKCDRAQPCTPCARRGDQSNCKWAVMETKDGAPTRAEFEALQARLAHVERTLAARPPPPPPHPHMHAPPPHAYAPYHHPYPAPPPHPHPHLHPHPHHPPPPFARGAPYATNGPVFPPPAPMAPASPGSRAAPIKIEADSPPRTPSPAPPAAARPTLRLLPEALRRTGSPGRLSGTTFPLSDADWEQMTSVALAGANKTRAAAGAMHVDVQRELEALVGALPPRAACDRMWAAYVARLEWVHCVVHPGAFQQMYDTFWAFKTGAERAACTPIAWLALLLAVMSHGLATLRPAEARAAGIAEDTPHWRMLCTQLWIASERALALDNFSHAVTLEVVQTLVLLSYRAISLDPKGWFHQAPILAMAIRLAMSIGLSNVVGDKPGEVPPPDLYRRELYRRIWFNIVYLDWRFSVPMGETYFINTFHYNTAWPANLDWGGMADGGAFRSQPRAAFTSASLFLAKVHNAERVKELCDALNLATRSGHADVSRLFYDHEVAVNDNIAREPACLIQVDAAMEAADQRVQWARIGHTLELDYRAIQIHRSFLVADFREARARAVCVDTAEKMLRCFAEGKRADAPTAWWWYGYTACVVLMMEQYYAEPGDAGARLAQRLEDIGAYVAMQRTCEEVTARAWDGILILETLLAELQKRRTAAAAATASPSAASPSAATATATTAPAPAPAPVPAPAAPPSPPAARAKDAAPAVTRVPSSSPVHAFRKWILNVLPFLKLAPVPGVPAAHPRQRDMDGVFWDAILDIDTELHKASRRGGFGRA